MTNDEKIRAGIRSVMSKRGISQAELARRLGITAQSLNQVIGGARAGLPKSLTAVLDALNLELNVQDSADVLVPVVRAAPEKPEGELSPDDKTWLESFLDAAKGKDTSAPPPGSIVVVRFDKQVRPALTLTPADTATCSIVMLTPTTKSGGGGPTLGVQHGAPATSGVLSEVHTIAVERIGGVVGPLHPSRKMREVRDAVIDFLMLGDGRSKK